MALALLLFFMISVSGLGIKTNKTKKRRSILAPSSSSKIKIENLIKY